MVDVDPSQSLAGQVAANFNIGIVPSLGPVVAAGLDSIVEVSLGLGRFYRVQQRVVRHIAGRDDHIFIKGIGLASLHFDGKRLLDALWLVFEFDQLARFAIGAR